MKLTKQQEAEVKKRVDKEVMKALMFGCNQILDSFEDSTFNAIREGYKGIACVAILDKIKEHRRNLK